MANTVMNPYYSYPANTGFTNPIVNLYTANNEQTLLSDLNIEMIQFHGINNYYLPRTHRNYDELYKQDDMSHFTSAYQLEMFLIDVNSFEGEGTFLSKFGLEVRDRCSLAVSRARFNTVVGIPTGFVRPREGDLIFFGMTNKLFEIIYVDKRAQFYPLGSLPTFNLDCEVYEYNGEVFSTGVSVIDTLVAGLTIDNNTDPLLDANSHPILDSGGFQQPAFDPQDRDALWDNEFIRQQANTTIDRTESDPFSGDDL